MWRSIGGDADISFFSARDALYGNDATLVGTVLLLLINSSLLLVNGVRDVIDVARDAPVATRCITRCALDASGAHDAAAVAAREAHKHIPDAISQAGVWLGEHRRTAYCWAAVELLLQAGTLRLMCQLVATCANSSQLAALAKRIRMRRSGRVH